MIVTGIKTYLVTLVLVLSILTLVAGKPGEYWQGGGYGGYGAYGGGSYRRYHHRRYHHSHRRILRCSTMGSSMWDWRAMGRIHPCHCRSRCSTWYSGRHVCLNFHREGELCPVNNYAYGLCHRGLYCGFGTRCRRHDGSRACHSYIERHRVFYEDSSYSGMYK